MFGMSETRSLVAAPSNTTSPTSCSFVHSIYGAGRLLPSASRWNSIEFSFTILPPSAAYQDTAGSRFSKSIDFHLVVTDKPCLKRFLLILLSLVLIPLLIFLVLRFLPRHHPHADSSKNLTLALNQALLFFDAQKSGLLPDDNISYRRSSGLQDGNWRDKHTDLVGGFYDSGENVKYTFTTAYTLTLLSWSVIEYSKKYEAVGELDHIKNIIRWGTDYLLKVFVPFNSTTNHPAIIYSQVGDASSENGELNDKSCWQRPEDMSYPRPVSACSSSAADLAGEIVAALSSASLVFKEAEDYSHLLASTAVNLYEDAISNKHRGDYTQTEECGGLARNYYNSSGYWDELVWGGAWLFLATGNLSYLKNATDGFDAAVMAEAALDSGVLDWNNKLPAILVLTILFSRLRYFHDLGYPYEAALRQSSDKAGKLMCSYLHPRQVNFNMTPGGLILLRPNASAPLQYAATAAFLAKIYKDYLSSVGMLGVSCINVAESFSLDMLQEFSISQVEYILGENPMKMSYLVGFGNKYPTQVHHRGASIPDDGRRYSCSDGKRWLFSEDENPNILRGAMVAGPGNDDTFLDRRDEAKYTEPTLAGNAGLVAALVALHSSGSLDRTGIFANIDPDGHSN